MKKSTKKVPLEITNETRTEEIHKLLLGVRIRKKKECKKMGKRVKRKGKGIEGKRRKRGRKGRKKYESWGKKKREKRLGKM